MWKQDKTFHPPVLIGVAQPLFRADSYPKKSRFSPTLVGKIGGSYVLGDLGFGTILRVAADGDVAAAEAELT